MEPASPGKEFGCELCAGNDAIEAEKNRSNLKPTADLIDASHYSVSIGECPNCSQRWVAIFTELIDWNDGDDAQYNSLLPVTKLEADELQGLAGNVVSNRLNEIGKDRRYLQVDYPTGKPARIRWAEGNFMIGPHD